MVVCFIWILLLLNRILVNVLTQNIYVLSRDCQTPAAQDRLLYQNTKHLQIENLEDGIVVYSHDLTNFHNHTAAAFQNVNLSSTYTFYPRGFSCEIIVQSSLKSAKIMLRIENFYIPSNTDDCVDNYLYVFDSNTAKAKAMPEAGGERGLCGAAYPRFPIFTTNPYICIAFHTSGIRPPTTSNQHPGFRLILTAVQETTTQSCSSGSFYCGVRPSLVRSTVDAGSALFTDRRPYSTLLGSSSSKQRGSEVSPGLLAEQTVGAQRQQPGLGYCISLRTVCDGVSNCADGRDESPEHCHRRGLTDTEWIEEDAQAVGGLSGLLSLGIPASIAIAVSTIVTFTIGIGAVVCCCHRCCRSSPSRVSRYPRITGNSFSRQFDLAVAGGTTYHSRSGLNESGTTSRQLSRFITPGEANFPSLLNGTQHGHLSSPYNHPGVASLHCGNTQSGHLRSGNISQGDKPPQELLTRVGPKIPYSDGGERSTGAPSAEDMSIGPQHQLHRPIAYSSVAGSNSYSSIHGNITMGCTPYRTPPGPPPALIPGAMGSPDAYRRDPSLGDHCCYTPPPYGACTVPPASSVTASSSRTGTTSGNGLPPGQSTEQRGPGWCMRARLQDHAGYLVSGSVDGVGSAAGGSGTDLCTTDSTGMLFGQQLSGGGNSALHTNTPVETISQTGGDMVSNGGIVYLGEIIQPFSGDSANKFRGTSYAGAGSNTTGSGSSHGRTAHSHRLLMQDQTSQPTEFPANPTTATSTMASNQIYRVKTESIGPRRSRAPSHRQHRYRVQRSVDPNRAPSSGSHTPASSRSGLLTSSQRSAMEPIQHSSAHSLSKSDNSISFPVQL
ncbi:hypothetical protein CRM22_000608 [Opisthorchis felineus]|uniref:CUB domain-containing protein n=1 Tax=Opisthorchis felineus TaxID=147828 RepID=A0A4S2MIR6_OPIFE|nr:hypothetical protein CRM22_000608 [Opisthorchis felineus]TGZ75040.1 hypothetical protein CRM22_000608 [Opisthorchis felineus]